MAQLEFNKGVPLSVEKGKGGTIIALLALIMVVGVQAFDELAAHGGGVASDVVVVGKKLYVGEEDRSMPQLSIFRARPLPI